MKIFNENIRPLRYENAYGEIVENEIVKIIDYFEIIDEIEFKNFTEVFSRHIIGDIDDSVETVMERYFDIK